MTQEEKAKAYDEAIQKLRGMMPNWERLSYNGKTFLQDLIHIFPELKESEDEKIRKEILDYIDKATGCKRWIAWLEKQGEQEPNVCDGCNNVKGCIACVDGSEWAHIEELNPAWSEEDKDFMYDTLSNLTELKDRYGEGYGNVGKCIGWLKSLRPQNTWKPSEEQMMALMWVRQNIPYCLEKEVLSEMYEQLKKLKG